MNCQIKIKSAGNDWENVHKGEAQFFQHENGFGVEYEYEGDTCKFVVDNHEAFQMRTGAIGVDIHFMLGRQTQCMFTTSHGTGGYSVYTKKLDYQLHERGALVDLVYLSGADKEKVTLHLEIRFQ
jgi:uncharacterized beta-barrel protein YwiB (DUF1934 family)